MPNYIRISGSFGESFHSNNVGLEFDDLYTDKLLERMIVLCRYCGSRNSFSNPTRVKCGAPLA